MAFKKILKLKNIKEKSLGEVSCSVMLEIAGRKRVCSVFLGE